MVRPAGVSEAAKGKKKASTAKPRPVATSRAKKKAPAKRKRASDGQIRKQLDTINQIKGRLKEIVEKFDASYPEGVDFTPNAVDVDYV